MSGALPGCGEKCSHRRAGSGNSPASGSTSMRAASRASQTDRGPGRADPPSGGRLCGRRGPRGARRSHGGRRRGGTGRRGRPGSAAPSACWAATAAHAGSLHHPPTPAFRTRVAPGQRHEVLPARVQHQAVVVQPAPAAGAPPAARAPCRTPSGACSRPPGSPAPGSPRSRRCAASAAAPAPPAPRRCAPGCARVAAACPLCHERPVRIQRLEVPRPPE